MGRKAGRNRDLHTAMVGKRQSNAAQPHKDRRLKRLQTRDAVKRQALKEYR